MTFSKAEGMREKGQRAGAMFARPGLARVPSDIIYSIYSIGENTFYKLYG